MKIDITELNIINLKPGQVLVVTISVDHVEHFDHIQKTLNDVFPDNKVIVKTNEIEFEVINGAPQD